ncbi:hypothetical protein V6N11_078906 [Hibiscus sabdariffa]|uniref:Uncharacterized protein n=1 Tax=Hibiscus sabdariffa TaxID=183260 RepID=A0ABR2RTR5_9ROSI
MQKKRRYPTAVPVPVPSTFADMVTKCRNFFTLAHKTLVFAYREENCKAHGLAQQGLHRVMVSFGTSGIHFDCCILNLVTPIHSTFCALV